MQRLLRLLLLVLTLLYGTTIDALRVATAGLSNATALAPTDLRVALAFDGEHVAADAVFSFALNPQLLSDATEVDTALLAAQLDGELQVAITDATVVVSRGADALDMTLVDDTLTLRLTGLTAPRVAGTASLGSVSVGTATDAVAYGAAPLPSVWVAPGQIWNAQVAFDTLLIGRATALTLTFTPANAVPVDGSMLVYLPRLYAASTAVLQGLTLARTTGVNGELLMDVRDTALRFSWDPSTTTNAVDGLDAMHTVVLHLEGLWQPLLEGPIGRIIRIETTVADNSVIDQTLLDVSGLMLARATVQLSTRSLSLQEAGDDSHYTISLTAPPVFATGVSVAIAAYFSDGVTAASGLLVEPSLVQFTASNWTQSVAITVAALADDVALPVASHYVLSHSILEAATETSFAPVDDLIVFVKDDDLPLVHLSHRYVAIAQGLRNDSYTIMLLAQPSSDVTVEIDSPSPLVSVDPSTVTFSAGAWAAAQTVRVQAASPVADASSSLSNALRTWLTHRIRSTDAAFTTVVPQSSVQVYYEPLTMVSCVEPCRAGWYPAINSSTAMPQCVACPLGSYCPGECTLPIPCTAGTASSAAFATVSSVCDACPIGAYAHTAGATVCSPCPAGAACPHKDAPFEPCPVGTFALESQGFCRSCPAGTYSNASFRDHCDACPVGFSCAGGTALPTICPNGTFAVDHGAHVCEPCPAGYVCTTNSPAPVKCLDGSYVLANETQCRLCPQGYYCPQTALPPVKCGQGSYSYAGSTACTLCPLGYACTLPDLPKACGIGEISNGNHSACVPCPVGYACPIAAATPVQCTAGSFSTGGAIVCTPCAAGYACPDTTSTQRTPCLAGTYALSGAASCTPCPAGYACPTTTSITFTPCPSGWYSPAGSAACTECPRGYFCDVPYELPKNCTIGSYSVTASTSCVPCDPGYECPRSDQLPQPCPIGYYSGGAVANCRACRPGYKCGLASTNPTPPEDACPMGGYCNPPTTFFLCPAGTYGNVTAGESVDQACVPCPDGFYCEMGSTPLTKQNCPAGYVCPVGTKRAAQFPCRAGTYNPLPNQFSADVCQLCPKGSFCVQGAATPVACPQGYVCPEGTVAPNQFPCPAGTYSGPRTGLTIASDCKPCDVGDYCPEASSTPTPCPAGTYNPSIGAAGVHECLACPPGWACPRVGQLEYVDRCAKGHFCPSATVVATAKPCPAGTFTERIDLIRADDCTVCPLRHACPEGTGGETQTMLDCGAGFFCPNGTAYAAQFPCPPGFWSASTSLADATECDVCPVGKFCSGGKSFIDGPCSPGYYCPLGTPSPTKFPCPSGTFTAKTSLFEPSQCDDCPPGSYCPAGSIAPIPCKPGSFSSFNNTKSVGPGSAWPECVTCPAGYYCAEATITPAPCGKGKFSTKGSKNCATCEAGFFCNSNTTSDTNMRTDVVSWLAPGALFGKCYNGTYCPPGSDHEPAVEIDACPRGYFCPKATPAPVICPAGTYSNLTGQDEMSDCIPTPPGFYSLEGALQPTGPCAPGFYCPLRSTASTQIPCPARYYLNRTGGQSEDDCAVCVAGAYCPRGSAYPIACPTGSYCRTGVATPEPCPIGTYSNATSIKHVDDCLVCPPGMYCDATGLTVPRGPCDPGYYCALGAYTSAPMRYETTLFGVTNQNVGGQCPRGSYCPLGSAFPTPCPPGTFNNFTGLETERQCVQCPPGQYCETPGLELPTGDCSAGYYCTGGASTPTQVATPPGAFTGSAATAPIPCPAGQFNTYAMQDQCVDCPAGFVCGSPGTIRPTICPLGNYCPPSTALAIKCPPGTLNSMEGLVAGVQCQRCPAGVFCDSFGLVAPSGPCLEGFVCTGGSPVSNPNPSSNPVAVDYGFVCPAGHYCPVGSSTATQCPRGSFRALPGGTSLASCSLCPGGSYCSSTALTAPSGLCDPGYFCTENVSSATPAADASTGNGGPCPLGSFCPQGSAHSQFCPEGSYSDEARAAACTPCPAGYVCALGSVGYASRPCPQGYYCPVGTPRDFQFPCLPGSYGNRTGLQDVTQCTLAPGGMYVDGYAAVKASGFCKSGFYCAGGAATSTPPTASATGGPCLPGTNCPEGSAVPIVCDAGSYCSSSNTDKALPCDAGFYCVQGSYTANPTGQTNSLGSIGDVCTPGHYCPPGTSNPIPCPPGTFSENPQNRNASQCFPCSPGFVCTVSGIVTPSEKCPMGFVCTGGEREATQLCPRGAECPLGSAAPRLCPPGTFSDVEGLGLCKLCPERFYCVAGTTTPAPCPPGFFCPLQTPQATAYPCPPGTFSNATRVASAAECVACAPGTFCSGAAPTDRPTGDCAPGYYCIEGATTATPSDGRTGDLCAGGFVCVGGASRPDPLDSLTGRACQPGFYCPRGSSTPVRCAKGSYNPFEKQSVCGPCPAGGYCDTNATSPVPCPIRYFCPEGTSEPVLCPAGTYGHATALASANQCAPCAAGKFCVGGTLTASCAAGYYCKLFNAAPNPVLPNITTNSSGFDFGGPCPIGHYCPQGVLDPIPCTNGTARLATHATQDTDCGPCPAGMSCANGAVTVPCPAGHYCAYAQSAVVCPAGTYNPLPGQVDEADCQPCIPGKLCNATAIVELTTRYDCPKGFYCEAAVTLPTPCPVGRFRRTPGAATIDDCALCTGGSSCGVATVEPTVCVSRTYCPRGAGEPLPCPGGAYCPFNSSVFIQCPVGFYCPMESARPIACARGFYCPLGSVAPLACPLGFIGRVTPLNGVLSRLGDACEACPAGTYGIDPNRTRCDVCLEGYVCLEATRASHPQSKDDDNGYPCPPGSYCPAGSATELPCPSGSYQPNFLATTATACRPCPSNAYQNTMGQANCLPCSKSAYASGGATVCTCKGSHRAFQMTDGYCICEPGYEFYDQDMVLRSDEDDDVDCQPIVYDRCGATQVRADGGACVPASQTSCAQSCGGTNATGTLVPSLGICQCDQQADVDVVCNKKCRDDALQVRVDAATGALETYDPATGTVESLADSASSLGIVSKVSCTGDASACQLHTVALTSGGFAGSYAAPPNVEAASSSSRRRLTSTTTATIANPMVCLHVGQGIFFDLPTPGAFPIYLKDSMLNTNPTFDYGAFRALATKVKANTATVSAFAFSFSEAGIYVFGNSLNGAAKTVITVMQAGTACPTEAAIMPLNEKNLIAVSVKRRTDDIILAPDWELIIGLLGGLVGMVVAVIAGLYYFRTKSWATSSTRRRLLGYRATSKATDLATMHSKGVATANKASAVPTGDAMYTPSPVMILDDGTPSAVDSGSPPWSKHLLGHGDRGGGGGGGGGGFSPAGLARWEEEDLDLRELVERLQQHHDAVTKCFDDQKGDVQSLLQHLQHESAELKRLLMNALTSVPSLQPASSSGALLMQEPSVVVPHDSRSPIPPSMAVRPDAVPQATRTTMATPPLVLTPPPAASVPSSAPQSVQMTGKNAPATTVAALSAGPAVPQDTLRPAAETKAKADAMATRQEQVQTEYVATLRDQFPQLSSDERQRLVDEFASDLGRLESSLSVEAHKTQEDVQTLQTARTVLAESHARAMQAAAEQQTRALEADQEQKRTTLESKFAEEEDAIEQEYQRELLELEQEFAALEDEEDEVAFDEDEGDAATARSGEEGGREDSDAESVEDEETSRSARSSEARKTYMLDALRRRRTDVSGIERLAAGEKASMAADAAVVTALEKEIANVQQLFAASIEDQARELERDADTKKKQLRERIVARKHATQSPSQLLALNAEETMAVAVIERELVAQRAQLERHLNAMEEATVDRMETSAVIMASDVDALLAHCRAEHEREAEALRAQLEQDRQKVEDSLKNRLAHRRQQHQANAASHLPTTTAESRVTLEREVEQEKRDARREMEKTLQQKHETTVRDLLERQRARVASLLDAATADANAQVDRSRHTVGAAEVELERLRAEHAREQTALEASLSADRLRQTDAFQNRLAARRLARLDDAKPSDDQQQIEQALENDTRQELLQFERELDQQETETVTAMVREHQTQDGAALDRFFAAVGDASVALATRSALVAAEQAEIDRLHEALAVGETQARDQELRDAALRAKRLVDRLAQRRLRLGTHESGPVLEADGALVEVAATAMATAIEDELMRVRNQYDADAQQRREQLQADAERRKAHLRDRLSRKQAAVETLRELSVGNVPSDHQLQADENAGISEIDADLDKQRAALDARAATCDQALVDCAESTTLEQIDDLERRLSACRHEYQQDAAAHRERLALERQARDRLLRDRLAQRRAQRLAASETVSDAADEEEAALEAEIVASTQQEQEALAINARELEAKYHQQIEAIATRVHDEAAQRRTAAQKEYERAEAERQRLLEDHDRERQTLNQAQEVERTKQKQRLRDTLAQRRAQTLANSKLDESAKHALTKQLKAEDKIETVTLLAELDAQREHATRDVHARHMHEEAAAWKAVGEASGLVAASEAARLVMDAARDVELSRLALELETALSGARDNDSSDAAARKARLAQRLGHRRQKEMERATVGVDLHDPHATVIRVIEDAVEKERERVQRQFAESLQHRVEEINSEAAKRKALVRERVELKRKALVMKASRANGLLPDEMRLEKEAITREETAAEAMIEEDAAFKKRAAEEDVYRQAKEVEQTLQHAAESHGDELEKLLVACRRDHETEAAAMQRSLALERQKRHAALEDRLAKRRREKLTEGSEPHSPEELVEIEAALVEDERRERRQLIQQLAAEETTRLADAETIQQRHVADLITHAERDIRDRQAPSHDALASAEAELRRVQDDYARELSVLKTSLATEQKRQEHKLHEKLAVRRAQRPPTASEEEAALIAVEEALELVALRETLELRAAEAMADMRLTHDPQTQQALRLLTQASANAVAAEAARQAVEAAWQVEKDRITAEFAQRRQRLHDDEATDVRSQKTKLQHRLQQRHQREKNLDLTSDASARLESDIDSNAIVSEVLESALDDELARTRRQFEASRTRRIAELEAEATGQKASLRERIERKRKALAMRAAATSSGPERDAIHAEQAALVEAQAAAETTIDHELVTRKREAETVIDRQQQIAIEALQSAAQATGDELEKLLAACKAAYDKEADALTQRLEHERQQRELALRDRLAKRRAEKRAETEKLLTGKSADEQHTALEAMDKELVAEETQAREQLMQSLQKEEVRSLAAAEVLLQRHSTEALEIADRVAQDRQAAVHANHAATETELQRVRDEHARELATLSASLEAERTRQEQMLHNKLTARRAQRRADGVSDDALAAEEALEMAELQDHLQQRAAREVEDERRRQDESEDALVLELAKLAAQAAAADTARRAIEAARQAEVERIAAEFAQSRQRSQEVEVADATSRKVKLQDRLAQRRHREKCKKIISTSSPRLEEDILDSKVVASEAMEDALAHERERIQQQYAASLDRRVTQIEAEAAAKKAALRDRIEQKRKALTIRAGRKVGVVGELSVDEEQRLQAEQSAADAAIDQERMEKMRAATEESVHQQRVTHAALALATTATSDELERLLDACQRAHASDADTLRRTLQQERVLQEQTLRDRLTRRREQRLAEALRQPGTNLLSEAEAAAVHAAIVKDVEDEGAREQAQLAQSLAEEEARRLEEAETVQRRNAAEKMKAMENEANTRGEQARATQAAAEDALRRAQDEHARETLALQASLEAERKRQEQKLQDKLAARRATRTPPTQTQQSQETREDEEEHAIAAEEALARIQLGEELQAQEAKAMDDERRRHAELEQAIAMQIATAAATAGAADAARKAIEAARQAEIDRIATEFAASRMRAMDADAADAEARRAKLDERRANKRRREIKDKSPTHKKEVTSSSRDMNRSPRLRSLTETETETEAEKEMMRLRSEHTAACEERVAALEQDAAMRKARLAERIAKQRQDARRSTAAALSAPSSEALEQELAIELETETRAIDATLAAEKQKILDDIAATHARGQASLAAAAQRTADEMEHLLRQCQETHNEETVKLQQVLEVERQRQEKTLQDRIAQRKQQRLKAQEQQQQQTVEGIAVVEDVAADEQETQALATQLDASEAAVWEAMRRKQQDELLALTQQADAAARQKQDDAKRVQESAELELDRLKRDHESEMTTLTASFEAEQKRQQQQLQQRIAARRTKQQKQQKETDDTDTLGKERVAKQLEEQEAADKLVLEQEMQIELARRLDHERARQRQQEAELVLRVAQAKIDAAAADAARHAMDAARHVELERLATEFDETSRALRQTHLTDLQTQKHKLETRVAAKKQKKLQELEAKREREHQKLRERQEQEARDAVAAQELAQAVVEETLTKAAGGQEEGNPDVSAPLVEEEGVILPSTDPTVEETKLQETKPTGDIVEEVADEAARAAQQARDIGALQQLVDARVVPSRMPLLAAIELVLSQRHQHETSQLLTQQSTHKTQAMRDALREILQRKTAAKAAVMQGHESQNQNHEVHEIYEQRLAALDAEYDEQIRRAEETVIHAEEAQASRHLQRLQYQQLSELQFLLAYFNGTVHQLQLQQQQEENDRRAQATQAELVGPGSEQRPRVVVVATDHDTDDRLNELRARLQLDADDRLQQLVLNQRSEQQSLQTELDADLRRLADDYDHLVEQERAAMETAFLERVRSLTSDAPQRSVLAREKNDQITSLLLMLRGRHAQHEARLRRLAATAVATLDHEYARKKEIVTAKMHQRLVEEKELLRQKQKAVATTTVPREEEIEEKEEKAKKEERREHVAEEDGEIVDLRRVLELRLITIEELLREQRMGPDAKTQSTNDLDVYKQSLVHAIDEACQWRVLLHTAVDANDMALRFVPRDAMDDTTQTHVDFANALVQIMAATPPSPTDANKRRTVVDRVVVATGLPLTQDATPTLTHFDAATQTLWVDAACVAQLSAGQLALVVVHGVAAAETQTHDAADPQFMGCVYRLLVQCYQTLFLSSSQSNPPTKEVPTIDAISPPRVQPMGDKKRPAAENKAGQWQSRLTAMESFLSDFSDRSSDSKAPSPPRLGRESSQLKRSTMSLSLSSRLLLPGTLVASEEMDAMVVLERRQFLLEKLDAAEKLYAHVLRQYQEQKQAREFVHEMLEQEKDRERPGSSPSPSSQAIADPLRLDALQHEAETIEQALVKTRRERDDLFVQCQALRDELQHVMDGAQAESKT